MDNNKEERKKPRTQERKVKQRGYSAATRRRQQIELEKEREEHVARLQQVLSLRQQLTVTQTQYNILQNELQIRNVLLLITVFLNIQLQNKCATLEEKERDKQQETNLMIQQITDETIVPPEIHDNNVAQTSKETEFIEVDVDVNVDVVAEMLEEAAALQPSGSSPIDFSTVWSPSDAALFD